MTRNDLILRVALRMDEITPESALSEITVDGSDNNPLYELIDGIIDDGALELFSAAPYWRLPQSSFQDVAVEDLPALFGSRKVVRLKVPDDFLRVAEINCKGFQRPITEVVPEMSEAGKRQHNRWLMAKEARPVGVISHGEWGPDGEKVHCREVDCYSLASDSDVTPSSGIDATYIPKPGVIGTVEDSVPAVLIPALEWLVAARAFGARGDANHAAICQQNAQNLLV